MFGKNKKNHYRCNAIKNQKNIGADFVYEPG